MIEENNILTFDTDDEFTDYCLCCSPEYSFNETHNIYVYDYPYTQNYLNAIDANKQFKIKDENSKVFKRGCVCRGTINKPVKNLIAYRDWFANECY